MYWTIIHVQEAGLQTRAQMEYIKAQNDLMQAASERNAIQSLEQKLVAMMDEQKKAFQVYITYKHANTTTTVVTTDVQLLLRWYCYDTAVILLWYCYKV